MNNFPKPEAMTAVFERRAHLSPDYYSLQFKLKESFRFIPGQYVSFHIAPPKLRHPMSLASAPDRDSFEILQCVAPGGQGSHWSQELVQGDEVTFTGPLGSLTLNDQSQKKMVFVATGCGIAPFRSIITHYLLQGGRNEVMLYWGMRHVRDLFWQDEFKNFVAKYPNFRYIVSLSQPEDSWQGARGRVTEHVIQEEKDLLNSEFYLCGSLLMISDIKRQLAEANIPPVQIFTESFY